MNALNREEMVSLITRSIFAPFDLASGTRQVRRPRETMPLTVAVRYVAVSDAAHRSCVRLARNVPTVVFGHQARVITENEGSRPDGKGGASGGGALESGRWRGLCRRVGIQPRCRYPPSTISVVPVI